MQTETLLSRAKEMYPELVTIRREIHSHPETGLDTAGTAAIVKRELKKMGYEPQDIGTNGVTATIGKPGKTFLLRADMDALQMQEESGLPFASQTPGAAHCCGHDLHTTMLLGAAKLLKEHEGELEGTVKLMFQPGEENMQGARNLIEAGILENPKVDAALSLHVNAHVPCGALLVFSGPACSSSDLFTIEVKGHGGHGSRPHNTIDPLNVASHIHIALQELQARELPGGELGVLTIGCIQGGSTFNVIPSEAVLKGTIRTYDKEIRSMLIQRMQEICDHVAKAFRAEVNVILHDEYTIPLVADAQVSAAAGKALRELFPEQQVRDMKKALPGSEDFAFVSDLVPSTLLGLGASVEPKSPYGQHHPKVQFNENCLPVGAAAEAQVAIQWLKEHK